MEEWNEKYSLWLKEPNVYYENFVNRLDCGLEQSELSMIDREIKKTPPWIGYAIHTDWCHTDTECYLSKLTVPVFLAFGELSEGKSSMGRHYRKQVKTPCVLYEFQKGGHIFFGVDNLNFNDRLQEFIKSIDMKKSIEKTEGRAGA